MFIVVHYNYNPQFCNGRFEGISVCVKFCFMPRDICFTNTGDKMWVYFYESETKQQSFSVEKPTLSCLEKTGQVRPSIKSFLVIFYSLWGRCTSGMFLQATQLMSITTKRCCYVWGSRSSEHIWNGGRTMIRWFTVTVHWTSLLCQGKVLTTKNIHGVPYPPYVPDLASHDSSCFQDWNCSSEGVTVRCPWNLGTGMQCKKSSSSSGRYAAPIA